MPESRDYLEMSFKSIQCFSDDGKLDARELGKILAIAEKDGVIDQNEIRVLRNIIARVKPHEVDDAMRAKMLESVKKLVSPQGGIHRDAFFISPQSHPHPLARSSGE